ncbi:TVP38/TMEM64 family protein [Clostridium oryzae]|uniref:TVP38/TMEM64 family membrane protein n=1 Tax=Clostridium oryzae TaxID=1450648 RepID=A0A1V4IX39_9CLOT|nr:VTT domain-containing protein [Clostridium oryzae]OPJ63977.1 SNARE associated golgi protein [Clostridium oryzae]
MNKLFKIIILIFWASILFIFFKCQLYDHGIRKIICFLRSYPQYSALLFLVIASLRSFTLIPSTFFVIIAGMLFNPIEAFILAATANILSEVLVFFVAKFSFSPSYQNKMINKYPKIYKMVQNNTMQILALGVSSPIIPSDIVCLFCAFTGMSFTKYISTIFLADTPVIFLYTFLGISIKYSIYIFIVTLVAIIIFSYFNMKKLDSQME